MGISEKNVPEERIIWGPTMRRIQALETALRRPGPMGQTAYGESPHVRPPGRPENLVVAGQVVVQDETGETWVEVHLTWEGTADAFEVAWSRVEGFTW